MCPTSLCARRWLSLLEEVGANAGADRECAERAAGEPGAPSTFEPEEDRGLRVVGAGFMPAAVDSIARSHHTIPAPGPAPDRIRFAGPAPD